MMPRGPRPSYRQKADPCAVWILCAALTWATGFGVSLWYTGLFFWSVFIGVWSVIGMEGLKLVVAAFLVVFFPEGGRR